MPNSLLQGFFCCRPVTASDVQSIERKLMQTMDMILAKKKRIALAQRGDGLRSRDQGATGKQGGIWGMLRNVTISPASSGESILLYLIFDT